MENNFNEDNFEEFLQNQLHNHRMFPKDSVWREINIKLHGEKRWPALTFASFILVSITTFICLHFSSTQNIFSTKPILIPLHAEKLKAKKLPNISAAKLNSINFNNKDNSSFNELRTNKSDETFLDINNNSSQSQINSETTKINFSKHNNPSDIVNVHHNDIVKESFEQNIISSNNNSKLLKELSIFDQQLNSESRKLSLPLQPLLSASTETVLSNDIVNSTEEKNDSQIDLFKANRKPGKFNIAVYLAPSISYRKLVEDQSVIKGINNGPVAVNQVADVNDVVRHKPSKGLEGGISLMYDINKKIKVKSGFQFNMRQYAIDAYRSNTEISSIALVDNNEINTVNTLVYYRNFNGNSSTELINRYYQISLPMGLDWEIAGNKKIQFNIAGSIQPTYILNKSAYLLTTNFKNYSESNSLVRQWNINSNFEAYVSMVVGDVKWQLGPQIRYQPNSTFISQYPIHEYLIDYGIKLGISTNLK